MFTQYTPYNADVKRWANETRELTVADRIAYGVALGLRDGYLRAKDEDALLLEAAKAAVKAIGVVQGEWTGVLPLYAPEWTYPLKEATEDLEAAIAAAEGRTA